jgi:Hemerythrin HHE cation binding domain
MPVRIGAKSHSVSEPTGLLSECHRRIEMFLRSLEGVALAIARPLTEETRPALESALRYFREAAPQHAADEEESLFPRLREMLHADVESALEKLRPLEDEHRWAGALHAALEELGQRCLRTGSLSKTETDAFRKAIASLSRCRSSTSGSRTTWFFLLQRDCCPPPTRLPSLTKWRLDEK